MAPDPDVGMAVETAEMEAGSTVVELTVTLSARVATHGGGGETHA